MDEGVETALAVTDDLFLIEGMEVRLDSYSVFWKFRKVSLEGMSRDLSQGLCS